MSGTIEIINTDLGVPFTGALMDDMVIRTALSNQRIHFASGSNMVPVMTLSNNNVGIGTMTPEAPLHVAGNARFTGSMTIGSQLYLNGLLLQRRSIPGAFNVTQSTGNIEGFTRVNGNALIAASNGCNVIFMTSSNTTAATITGNNQFMGLGTTTPAQRLDVIGNIACSGSVITSNLELSGGISMSNRQMNMSRLSFTRATVVGAANNFTTAVTSIPQLNTSNGVNYDFSLNNTQTLYRFLDSAGIPEMTLSSTGNLTVLGNISAGNLGMFRNRLINGNMSIDQRNLGAAVTLNANSSPVFPVDRFFSIRTGTLVATVTQSNINYAVSDFPTAVCSTVSTPQSTLASGDYFTLLEQRIEGINIADFQWGTTNARPILVSFYCMSTVASTFHFAIRNASGTIVTHVIPFDLQANTWTRQVFNIPGPTFGTWTIDTSIGAIVGIHAGAGSSHVVSQTSTWILNSHGITTTSGANTFMNTANARFFVTGFQLEIGTIVTPYEVRPTDLELILCKRYWQDIPERNKIRGISAGVKHGGSFRLPYTLPVQMRAIPTVSYTGRIILSNGGTDFDITGIINAGWLGRSQGMIDFSDAGLGSGLAATMYAAPGANLIFNAELI